MHQIMIPVSVSRPATNDGPATPSIQQVIDLETNGTPQTLVAQDFLAGLDAEGLALLRRSIHRHRHAGTPRFVCGYCREPVHIRVTSVAASGVSDGRRAMFVHDPRGTLRDCPYGNFSGHDSPAMIDGQRFRGQQEGARHKRLKTEICEMLQADPAVASANVEVLVTGLTPDGHKTWRRPDVLAVMHDGRRLAIDVQLAAPLIHTIDGRERFYAAEGIAWHWVVDADQPALLQLQGFQDLTLPQASRVLGFNDTIANIAKSDNQTRFHLLHIIPSQDHHKFQVRTKIIGLEWTLALAGFPSNGPTRYAIDLRAIGFFNAIYRGHNTRAGRIFDLIAATSGVPGWAAADLDHLPKAITALVTLIGARDIDVERAHLTALLTVDPQGREPQGDVSGIPSHAWVFLVMALAKTDSALRDRIVACGEDTLGLVKSAFAEIAADPAPSRQLQTKWGPLLHRLFPRLPA